MRAVIVWVKSLLSVKKSNIIMAIMNKILTLMVILLLAAQIQGQISYLSSVQVQESSFAQFVQVHTCKTFMGSQTSHYVYDYSGVIPRSARCNTLRLNIALKSQYVNNYYCWARTYGYDGGKFFEHYTLGYQYPQQGSRDNGETIDIPCQNVRSF